MKKVGTFGDFAIFSLTKSTINFGGGVLVTNNNEIYKNAIKIQDKENLSLKKKDSKHSFYRRIWPAAGYRKADN